MGPDMDLRHPPRSFGQRHAPALVAGVLLHLALFGALRWGAGPEAPAQALQVVQALLLNDPVPAKAAPPVPAPSSPPPPARTPTTPAPVSAPAPVPAPAALATSPAPVAAPVPGPAAPAPAAPVALAAPAAKGVRTAATVQLGACEKPAYPSASVRLEEEGTVHLRFLVGTDGRVVQSEVLKSSGFKRLDEAARTGLAKCLFKPATVDGQPEQAWASIQYTWRLE